MRYKDIIVIGSGPSLSQLRYLERLYFHECIVIGVNQACQIFSVDYIVYLDKLMDNFITDPLNLINNIEKSEKNPPTCLSYHRNETLIKLENGFGFKPDVINDGGNSGYMAINLAGHLAGKKIYLLGFDLTDDNIISGITRNSQYTNIQEELHAKQLKFNNMNKLIEDISTSGKQVFNVRGNKLLHPSGWINEIPLTYKEFFDIKRLD